MMTMMTKSRDDHVNHNDWSREGHIEDHEGINKYFFLKTTNGISNDNGTMMVAIIMIMMKTKNILCFLPPKKETTQT